MKKIALWQGSFMAGWKQLHDLGKVGPMYGKDYYYVLDLWEKCFRPVPATDFILLYADKLPDVPPVT